MKASRVAMGLLLLGVAACGDAGVAPVAGDPPTQFIIVRRAWRPGERDSVLTAVQANRAFSIPYVGDVSDYAPAFLAPDSVSEIVPNPAYAVTADASPFGPLFALDGVRVPGTGWSSASIDVHIVNNQQGGDTFDWLGVFWYNGSEVTWKGFVLAATAATTLPATAVNTAAFDAANAKSGIGAGEARASNGTYWQANGTGSPNTFRVSSSGTVGGATTITSGPFLGGQQWNHQANVTLSGIGMTRVLGTGLPTTQTASLSGTITGLAFSCVFPSPCKTNVPLIAADGRAHAPRSDAARPAWLSGRPARAVVAAGAALRPFRPPAAP